MGGFEVRLRGECIPPARPAQSLTAGRKSILPRGKGCWKSRGDCGPSTSGGISPRHTKVGHDSTIRKLTVRDNLAGCAGRGAVTIVTGGIDVGQSYLPANRDRQAYPRHRGLSCEDVVDGERNLKHD